MPSTKAILKSIEEQSKTLAELLIKEFTKQAVADTKDFLEKSRDDIERWAGELAREEIDEDDLASLMRGKKDLAEMRALKQAGLAQVSIDTFTNGVLEIAINAIMAAVP
jgi:DNA topoisomerase VI subunit B